MCFASLNVWSIVPAWQDPEIQDGRETGFVFSHGDFAFSLPLPLRWHAERVSKQPRSVSQCLYIFCTQRAKRTFSPCTGKCQERKAYTTAAREAASPLLRSPVAADRQAECLRLRLQNKENKVAGTRSWVPKDCCCASPTCAQPAQ